MLDKIISDNIVKTIVNIAKSALPQAIDAAQRNEIVVKILKDLKLDPTQPPQDVNGVYVYALVEYGVDKNEPILKLFREKEIKNAFWSAYTSNNPIGFSNKVEEFLDWNILGDEIRELGVDVRSELEEFGRVFIGVAKRSKSPEFRPYPDWNLDEYPAEFKSLIMEKIKAFCGREFVFKEFEKFIQDNPNGYFTLVGDAGMGKSAIAAKYVYDYKYPCHFNIRADGRNRPELFLESIRKQLMRRYGLGNTDKVGLSALLQKVSENLRGQKLVIVVDALDEVEQTGGGNILDLPTTLPDGVYFFLTRRPYERENKRLSVSRMKELDLRDSEYQGLSRDDVKEHISSKLNENSDYGVKLQNWVQKRDINKEDFIKQVADKSENNFMYLRYVLPDIAKGYYPDLSLNKLPDGLQDYYQQHWVRMGMEDKPQEDKVIVLFILVEIGTPIPCEMIADIAKQDEFEVQQVLDRWVEYLRKQEIDGDICYSTYHASFLDFLKDQPSLNPKKRKLLQQVNQNIVEYWEME
ncbi:MAG: NACHT domain protein [Microcoleaceae cyanobacterium]